MSINRCLANNHETIKGTRPGLEDGGEIDNVAVIQIRKAWGFNPCCTCVSSGACFAEKILSSYYCFCLSWLTGSSGSIAKLCNCQVRVSIGLDGSTIRLIPPPITRIWCYVVKLPISNPTNPMAPRPVAQSILASAKIFCLILTMPTTQA